MSTVFTGTVVGHIGSDAELRYLDDGKPVVNFSVAHSVKRKDKENTTWLRVAVFGKQGEAISGWLTKGKQVLVNGDIEAREYVNKDGISKTSIDMVANRVVFLGKKESEEITTPNGNAAIKVSVTEPSAPF